jgi:hypothetical protein
VTALGTWPVPAKGSDTTPFALSVTVTVPVKLVADVGRKLMVRKQLACATNAPPVLQVERVVLIENVEPEILMLEMLSGTEFVFFRTN